MQKLRLRDKKGMKERYQHETKKNDGAVYDGLSGNGGCRMRQLDNHSNSSF